MSFGVHNNQNVAIRSLKHVQGHYYKPISHTKAIYGPVKTRVQNKFHSYRVFCQVKVKGVMHSNMTVFNGMLWNMNLHETYKTYIQNSKKYKTGYDSFYLQAISAD